MNNARTLLSIIVLLAVVSIGAQAQERTFAKANIPFAFTVENVNLPAGTYTISALPPYNMIKMQSEEGGNAAMAPVIPTPAKAESSQSKLVFQRIGDHYFLARVWERGNSIRRDLLGGKLQHELAKNNASMRTATILAVGPR